MLERQYVREVQLVHLQQAVAKIFLDTRAWVMPRRSLSKPETVTLPYITCCVATDWLKTRLRVRTGNRVEVLDHGTLSSCRLDESK